MAAEGAVWSYIHAGSRLGVLVEINCETDFVARGEKFRELVNDMAMQASLCIRACSTHLPEPCAARAGAIASETADLPPPRCRRRRCCCRLPPAPR